MLPTIRTFRNTDVAAICKVWNAHYGDLGTHCQLTPLQLELSTLAKPYFESQDLLVAEYDEQIIGFLHVGPVPNEVLSDSKEHSAAIAALCIVPCNEETLAAQLLLRQAEKILVERGTQLCSFKPLAPATPFYQGFGPADSMIGATTSERRGCEWIRAAGFTPVQPTTQWELDLGRYQPPIDRVQIQIRRSATVERLPEEPLLPWWQACWLGHMEPFQFDLIHRAQRRIMCGALFWSVAMELQTSPDSIAWLWTPSIPDEEMGGDSITFLLGEACRQLQSERLDLIRTVTTASDIPIHAILRRLSFTSEQSGVVFEKRLDSVRQ